MKAGCMSDEIQQVPARTSWALIAARTAAALMTVSCILWNADAPAWFGTAYLTEQYLALILGLSIFGVYMTRRLNGNRDNYPPIWDIALAAAGLAACLWLMVYFGPVIDQLADRPMYMILLGGLLIGLVLEGVRRDTGWILFFIVSIFIVYTKIGHLIPGDFEGSKIPLDRLVVYLGIDPSAGFGISMRVGASVVILFVFFGNLLFKAGGGEFFTDLALALTGRTRGGAAKISVIGSALFGSISGSAVSNVVTTGTITIPMMRRAGYTAVEAGAMEAVASTGGQLMPPIMGAAAFLMAEFLEIAYVTIMAAALVPSLLYYLSAFVQADLIAARDNIRFVDAKMPTLGRVMAEGWHFVVPFVVLIIAFVWLSAEAERAALYSALSILIVGALRSYKGYRLNPRILLACLWDTGFATMGLMLIVACAGYVIGSLNISGLGFALTFFIVKSAGESLFFILFISAIICIILGMGMPTTGVYLLLAALVAPALVEAGVEKLAAHMFIFYFGMMSMITPPIALCAFAATSISGASPMATGFMAMRIGWIAYVVPFLFVYEPEIILQGTWGGILWSGLRAAVCTYIVSVALIGYLALPLSWLGRGAALAAGGLLIASFILDEHDIMLTIGALVAIAIMVATQWLAGAWRGNADADIKEPVQTG